MTSKAEWIALAERCEKATGSDREIDWSIHALSIEWPVHLVPRNPEHPTFTASLDDMTALIERELPEVTGIIPLTGGDEAWLWPKSGNPKGGWRCNAATPALALCAAFCRAMAAGA
jgi:hypothetical protein